MLIEAWREGKCRGGGTCLATTPYTGRAGIEERSRRGETTLIAQKSKRGEVGRGDTEQTRGKATSMSKDRAKGILTKKQV